VTIQGKRHYLWRAVGQDGDVIDILVLKYPNARAAQRASRFTVWFKTCSGWDDTTCDQRTSDCCGTDRVGIGAK
jgi:hypothetical protein